MRAARSSTGTWTISRRRWTALLSPGAEAYQVPTEHGEGFVTASVVDPFGNVLGIMDNRHHLEVLRTGLPGS
ncbi:hypothetical protein [Streptomyces sp. NPDC019507]|uniref:hypothetical protein n=1 Tax=Streptomyces sp. NPDC019507 TaxID=3154689 RepID=UPI003407DDC5